ncbi:MAG: MFS transporter [Gammaproteobacteria bacterium]|nr:MFS transporter [Gammaproteobacteria bacterium]
MTMHNRKSKLAWIPWALIACFFFYEFILRIFPGVITTELMKIFSINATGLGILSALFSYAYSTFQIPAGFLLDRYSPGWVIISACLLSVIGTILFNYSTTLIVAGIARFLMGLGGAFSFLGAMKMATIYLNSNDLPLVAGILGTLGYLGGITGTTILSMVCTSLGIHKTFILLSLLGLFISTLILLTTIAYRPTPVEKNSSTINLINLWPLLLSLIRHREVIIISLLSCLLYVPASVFAELWGTAYLQTAYAVSKTTAAIAITHLYIGVAIGSVTIGYLAKRSQNYAGLITRFSLLGAISIAAVIYLPFPSFIFIKALLFVFGFCFGCQLLTYPMLKNYVKTQYIGTVFGFANMFTLTAPAIFQPVVSYLLDLTWSSGDMVNQVRRYSLSNYHTAFVLLPLAMILSAGLCHGFLTKRPTRIIHDEQENTT